MRGVDVVRDAESIAGVFVREEIVEVVESRPGDCTVEDVSSCGPELIEGTHLRHSEQGS